MPNNLNINENIDLIFEKLDNFVKSKTVFGDPITVGDTTLIPVLKVSFGLGSGGGDGQDVKGSGGVGGGAGVGAKIHPCAVLSIRNGKTEILPISRVSGLEKLLESIPDMISKIKNQKSKGEDKKEENAENPEN